MSNENSHSKFSDVRIYHNQIQKLDGLTTIISNLVWHVFSLKNI